MKKVRTRITVLAIGLLLALALVSSSFAVDGTVTITRSELWVMSQLQRKVLSIAVTAGTSGAFTDAAINASTYAINGWHLYSVEIIPGSPAPSSGYNVLLNDSDGMDLTSGLGASLSGTDSKMFNVAGNALFSYPIVRGNLTLSISNMATTNCQTKIVLIFTPQVGF